MCGIVAYLGQSQNQVFRVLFDGLLMIQNRGYDSAGLCSIKEGHFLNRKFASCHQSSALERLKKYESCFEGCDIGISHTRWATHGAKSDNNAHPHIDSNGRFSLVHNGIIENYMELKKMLISKGYQFKSETDSEVIVNLISYEYDNCQCIDNSIANAMKKLEGTWALAIITILKPNNLYLCKNGSPLLLGFNETEVMAASEVSGFCNRAKQYIILENHDIISVDPKNFKKFTHYPYKVHEINESRIDLTPDPFPHWMIKEIEEQPESILRALNYGGRITSDYTIKLGGLEKNLSSLNHIENLLIIGCGTSLYAGLYASCWFKKLECFNTINMIDASEFDLNHLPREKAGVIVISQSGETKDVHRSMELIKKTDVPIISVVNVVDSLIAREADCGVYLNAGREVAVASTKSFTSQSVVLTLIAIWFAQCRSMSDRRRHLLIESLNSLSYQCSSIINDYRQKCRDLAQILKNNNNCFILGRDLLYPIALEGALKLKEIGYIHAEGFCGGALKHGPFALIGPDVPVIILSDTETRIKMESAIEEVKSRKSPVILISNHPSNQTVDYHIQINSDNKLVSLLYVIIFQLTAYYSSILKGNNPDFPRNLAKVVTVDG